MQSAHIVQPTEVAGISYYYPPAESVLDARDGKVNIPLEGFPIPLLKEDFSEETPSYDAVGRGIYHLLRVNPEAALADRYAALLRDGYPHLLAELATYLVMLDKKDVDLPYLDRKISYLKIFTLLEPDNPRLPFEIGATFFDKGMHLAAMRNTTLHLFAAEKYLRKSFNLAADDTQVICLLADVCYILGRYDDAGKLWKVIGSDLTTESAEKIRRRLNLIAGGNTPSVPAVDYLQAVGVALEAYETEDYEEAAAIILDVMEAVSVYDEFPLAEINYLLGLCYVKLDIPRYAEQYLKEAVRIRPDYEEAELEMQKLGVAP